MHPRHRRSIRHWTFLLAVFVIASAGCSAFDSQGSPARLAQTEEAQELEIIYRTDSARLAGADRSATTAQTALPGTPSDILPSFTTSTLQIRYPHPAGTQGQAQVRLMLQVPADEQENSFALAGSAADDRETSREAKLVEAWSLDVPAQNVDALIGKLQKQRFFQRARALGADSFLQVRMDDASFGKKYRPVPELDQLILLVRRDGRPLRQPPHGSAPARSTEPPVQPSGPLTRLPPVAP